MEHYRTRQRAAISLSLWTLGLWIVLVISTHSVLASTFVGLVTAAVSTTIVYFAASLGRDLWRRAWVVVGVHPLRSPQRCLEIATSIMFSSTAITSLGGKRLPHATVRVVLAPADLLELQNTRPREFIDRELTKEYRKQAERNPVGRSLIAFVDDDPFTPRGRFRVEPVFIKTPGTVADTAQQQAVETAVLDQHRVDDADAAPSWHEIDGRTEKLRINRDGVTVLDVAVTPAPRLVLHVGGHDVTVDREIVIGRAPGAGIVINDRHVSGRHATLRCTRAGWVIRDLQSTNGVYVDGQKVVKALLREGTRVRLGKRAGSPELVVRSVFEAVKVAL